MPWLARPGRLPCPHQLWAPMLTLFRLFVRRIFLLDSRRLPPRLRVPAAAAAGSQREQPRWEAAVMVVVPRTRVGTRTAMLLALVLVLATAVKSVMTMAMVVKMVIMMVPMLSLAVWWVLMKRLRPLRCKCCARRCQR